MLPLYIDSTFIVIKMCILTSYRYTHHYLSEDWLHTVYEDTHSRTKSGYIKKVLPLTYGLYYLFAIAILHPIYGYL